jgi:hypothetical protein
MRRTVSGLAVFAVLASAGAGVAGPVPPKRGVAQAKQEWLRDLYASARNGDRATRFPSPSRRELVGRLRRAAARYGFEILSVRMLHPLQRAPVIVIRSSHEHALARAIPAIIERFDPRHVTKANPSGYAYEGYFLEAIDARGVPFLATFNHWRAPRVGGGEWAAVESLYPFPHG